MAWKYLIFIGFLALSFQTRLKRKVEPIIWDRNRPLQWEDFKEKFDTDYAAVTFARVIYKITQKKDSSLVEITAIFDPSASFVNPKSKTNRLLMHEQGHFNIAEIFARKFRRLVKEEFGNTVVDSYKVRKISNRIARDCNSYQALYDKQTNFHRNDNKQEKWNARIEEELNELAEYEPATLVWSVRHTRTNRK